MGDSEKEEVLIRPEKSMCYVNTIHYRVQVRIHNAISCCKSVINFYEKNLHKNLISEACEEVLRQQPGKWCIREIKNLYYDKLDNEKETEKKQKTSSRINSADCSDAYLRNSFTTEPEDGQQYN